MKLKSCHCLLGLTIFIVPFLCSPGITQDASKSSQTPTVENSNTLYFGYVPDAYPISSEDVLIDDHLSPDTVCSKLLTYLRQNTNYSFKTFSSNNDVRFKKQIGKDKDGKYINLAIKCDPSSITTERINNLKTEGAKFSDPYFKTGVKFLVKKSLNISNSSQLSELVDRLKNKSIAVVEKTTTFQYLSINYSLSDLKTFPRETIYDIIKKRDIDAYAGDEIILKGVLWLYPDLKDKYTIIPTNQPPLTQEQYGIVVYEPSLLNTVNQWVNDKGKDFIKQKEAELDKEINPPEKLDKEINHPDTSNTIWLFLLVLIIVIVLFFLVKNKAIQNKTKTQEAISKSKKGEETGIKPPENNNNSQDSMANSNSGENTKNHSPFHFNPIFHVNQHQNDKEETSMSINQPINIKDTNIQGGFAVRDHTGDVTNNYNQKDNLKEAAAEIQQLLQQLEQSYPINTTAEKMVVATEAIKKIENNPDLKKRAINAAKEGGLAAFEKAIDNPIGAFIVQGIKGWQED